MEAVWDACGRRSEAVCSRKFGMSRIRCKSRLGFGVLSDRFQFLLFAAGGMYIS